MTNKKINLPKSIQDRLYFPKTSIKGDGCWNNLTHQQHSKLLNSWLNPVHMRGIMANLEETFQ